MEARDLFKKLVAEAVSRSDPESIMSYGSQHPSDFAKDKKSRAHLDGRFSHLTDEYIDNLSEHHLERELVTFIYRCFQQR